MIGRMIADRIERRWLAALVFLRERGDSRSDAWRRVAESIDERRDTLARFVTTDALAEEYIAVVLGRRVRIDDPRTQPNVFVRDASFGLRYVELCTHRSVSAISLPGWIGEWAVAER